MNMSKGTNFRNKKYNIGHDTLAYFKVYDDPMFGMGRAKSETQSAKLVPNLMTSASWIKFGGSFF